MADTEHLAILKQGVETWNRWRRDNPDVIPNFRGRTALPDAHLRGAHLSLAQFGPTLKAISDDRKPTYDAVNLGGADLSAADLREANLRGAFLVEADLSQADLSHACFVTSLLQRACLSNATLVGSHFVDSVLHQADFRNAVVGSTVFARVDLSAVIGLDSVRHLGPSFIDADTLILSGGRVPVNFLQGAGLPESLITYSESLLANPIHLYSCFLSYSSMDEDFVIRLHGDLRSNHVRCWFAPENLKIGDSFRQRIDESIHLHDKLLLVLSEHSVRSPWVQDEVETALERERREHRPILFPICIDDSVMETEVAWAASIRRTRHIGDFRNWKNPKCYEAALQRLLRDLKAEGGVDTAKSE